MKLSNRNNHQVNKLFIVIILLICLTPCTGQDIHTLATIDNGAYIKKPIKIEKINSKEVKGISGFYVALEYDFDDSISIFLDKKLISIYSLHYKLPKENVANYPNNRLLINLDKKVKIINYKSCTIIFQKKKAYVNFKLSKRYSFYNLGASNNLSIWSLYLGNTYPWTD